MQKRLLFILSVLACIHQIVACGSPFRPSNAYLPSYCGPNCLSIFLMMHGIPASLDDVARIAGKGRDGTTLLGLKMAAEARGVYARGVKLRSLRCLAEVGYPAIVLLKSENRGQVGHYVLITEISGDHVKIVDPPKMPYLAPLSSMDARTDGQALLLSTSPITLSSQVQSPWYAGLTIATVSLVLFLLWLSRKIARLRTARDVAHRRG